MPRSLLHPFRKSSGHPNSMNKLPLMSQQKFMKVKLRSVSKLAQSQPKLCPKSA